MVGSIVGVVGLGGIGLNIVRRLSSFRVSQFLYSGRKEKIEGGCFAEVPDIFLGQVISLYFEQFKYSAFVS